MRTCIKNVRVINGLGQCLEKADILFDEKILKISETSIEEGDQVIDGLGYTLIPGLIEAHAHLAMDASMNPFAVIAKDSEAATGIKQDVWNFITGRNLIISATDVSLGSQTQTGYCTYSTNQETGGTVVYKYVADRSGLVCISLDLSKKNSFSFWKNGIELYSETYSIPQTLAVSNVSAGDVIEVHLTCKANEKGTINLRAGILDETVFWSGYDTLASSQLQITKFENTRIEGTIQCNRNGVLYTSIPQDGNWTATVDGKPAETVSIGDAMVGLLLPEGEHTVMFVYRNKYFSLGWKISFVCLGVFAGLYWSIYQPKRKIGRFENKA